MDAELKEVLEGLQQQMQQGFADVRQEFANVRQEMAEGFAAVRRENAREHEKTRRYAEALNDDTRRQLREQIGELRTEIDVLRTGIRDVEHSLRDDIRAVADGVLVVNERVTRLEIEMRSGFAEVRELIHLSNVAIDQRFRRIENR